MTQKERMLASLPYKADLDGLEEERNECKKKTFEYNMTPPDRRGELKSKIKNILGKTGEDIVVEPPFHCDYGKNIKVGERFYVNYNLTVLDVAEVIGCKE